MINLFGSRSLSSLWGWIVRSFCAACTPCIQLFVCLRVLDSLHHILFCNLYFETTIKIKDSGNLMLITMKILARNAFKPLLVGEYNFLYKHLDLWR